MSIGIGGQTLPNIMGNAIGSSINGLVRIPALLANVAAVMVAGELAIRALSSVLSSIGFEAKSDNWVGLVSKKIVATGIRPFQDEEKHTTKELAYQLLCLTAISIVATEFARVLCGKAPAVYNNVLAFMGPIRIDSGSYLDNVRPLIQGARNVIGY